MNLLKLWSVLGGLADAIAGFTGTINEANAVARERLGLAQPVAAPALPCPPAAQPGNLNGHAAPEPAGPGQKKRR